MQREQKCSELYEEQCVRGELGFNLFVFVLCTINNRNIRYLDLGLQCQQYNKCMTIYCNGLSQAPHCPQNEQIPNVPPNGAGAGPQERAYPTIQKPNAGNHRYKL